MPRTVIICLCLSLSLLTMPKSEASSVAHERACDLPLGLSILHGATCSLPDEATEIPAFMNPPNSRASNISCDECPAAEQECDRICWENRRTCVYSCQARDTDCALQYCTCLPC
jgi:hypothetical protein